jgi:diacylglycerol O-acyltransferase
MNQPAQPLSHRLSGTDAAFLYLERREIPLHIACVCEFDGPIPFDEFVAAIDSKLHLVPRYRQVAVAPPFNLGYPTWESDPDFDISRHIFRAQVEAPGGQKELEALSGRILSQIMDRSKPLWDLHVVDGLADGRGALIVRVHHALADGVSGASLVRVMLDPTPEGSRAIRKPRVRPPAAPPKTPSLADALASAVHSSLENLIATQQGLLGLTQSLFTDRMQNSLQSLLGLLPELASPIERLPFNRLCDGNRLFCWEGFDFMDVQAIRAVVGGKVNDVLLTVLTRALAKYAKLHGQSVDGRLVRIVCPVSIRGDQGESLGNRITFMPVVLPMDGKDPVRMMQAVAARTEIMKNSGAAELLALAASWLGSAPPPLQAAFWGGLPFLTLPTSLFNIICTNVPGSPVPLYAVGRRMLASYPQVPTGWELGVGVAAQSYAGKLSFGLTADSHAAPDVTRLRDFIRVSFEELCRGAGIRKPRKTRARKPRAPQEPKAPESPEPSAPVFAAAS